MPGSNHGPSIKNPRVYEALRRRRGMSKQRAAAISNAMVKELGTVIPPTGPNALFNQPGVRSVRRRRRLKGWDAKVGQTIIGNLVRGEGGRFSGSGQPSARATNSEAQRKRAAERRSARQNRAAERAAAHEAEAAQEEATRTEEDSYIAAGATGRERQRRRAEIAAKRRQRAAARREARRREADAERAARQQEDEQEAKTRAEEQAAADAKKGGGGGGGGGKAKPTDDEKKAEQAKKRAENRTKTAPQAGLSAEEAEFLAGAASGTLPPGSFNAANLTALGLVQDTGDSTEATDAGRRALAALERGDVRGALAAIQDGKAKVARDKVRAEAQRKREEERRKRDARKVPDTGRREPGKKKKPAPNRGPLPPRNLPPKTLPKVDAAAERARSQDLARRVIRNLAERRQRRRRKEAPDQPSRIAINQMRLPDRAPEGSIAHDMTLKAKRTRTADEEKAMFAAMGGGSKGGGGGGGSGGSGELWKRNPETGKREPTEAQRDAQQQREIRRLAISDKQRDVYATRAGDKAEAETRKRYRVESAGDGEYVLRDYSRSTSAYRGVSVASGSKDKAERALATKIRTARTRAENDARQSVNFYNSDARGGMYSTPSSAQRDQDKFKSFTVFKDASGADRWAAITTTAYQDKDQEWISCKAIQGVVKAGDGGAPRGPLRFWHVPGLDLGDCDYQAALDGGRLLLESGTFRSKAAARIGARAAALGYQMSPGFVHTRSEPRGGVFNHIALFERSFVPPGRASNPYTRLLTKETRMLTEEKKKEFEALAGDAEGRALLQQLLTQAETTTKAADAAGAIYKDAPAWAQALVSEVQALTERVKAVETKAPMPAEEMVEAAATEMADGTAELVEETADDAASDLLDDEGFADLIVARLMAALGPLLELEKKMANWAGEIKAGLPQMQQQFAQKDDARAQEIATLKAAFEAGAKQGAELQERLKALEGDQPRAARTGLTAGVWGDLTGGIPVTKEQAAALAKQQRAGEVPAGLEPQYHDAHRLLWGNE